MLTEKDKEVISTLENMPIKIDNVAQGNIYLDAINYAIEKIKGRKTGTWNYTEYSQKFEGGGSLLMRGWVCSECGCFIRKKHGTTKYCHECGTEMQEADNENR